MTTDGLAEALFDWLDSDQTLTGGWYPLRLPDGVTLPAGTYQRISGQAPLTHSGGLASRTRRYQLSIFSERYLEGLAAARDLIAALNGVRDTWDGWDVTAYIADEAEDIDRADRGLFRQRVDVMITSEAP